MRSISSIISTLETSFRDTNFTEAELELKSMEQKLRSDYDASELQRSDLTLQNLRLEQENRRLKREFEISDHRVSELARELSVVEEREKKGIEWYECLIRSIRALKDEKAKILMELCEKNDEVSEKIMVLEWEKSEFVVELDGLRRENEGLVVAKAKADEEMEKMKRDLEDENKGLRADLCEKYEEICELKGIERRNEGQIKELSEKNEVLEGEFERVKRKVVILEMEKLDFQAKFDELRWENDRLVGDGKEKDRRVEELKRKVEGLEIENCIIIKEKDEVSRKYEEVEERLLKVEEDVANWLLQNVPIAKKVMGDQVEKVISGVPNALDSEQDHWTGRVEDIVGIDSVASHLNEVEVKTTSSFETEVPRETRAMDPKRNASPTLEVLSDTELGRENGTIGVKRDASLEVIVLSDSDCDNEDHSPLNELKRQRVLSQCWNQSIKLENCSVDSRNSSCKLKQLTTLPNEDSELKSSIAAFCRSDKVVTSKKQEVAPLRQCNETSGDKVKAPMSRGMVDDDSNSQHNDLSPQASVFCSPKARELITTCRGNRLRNFGVLEVLSTLLMKSSVFLPNVLIIILTRFSCLVCSREVAQVFCT